jgi:uncharacterized membrane protein
MPEARSDNPRQPKGGLSMSEPAQGSEMKQEPVAASSGVPPADVQEGKTFAVLSYVIGLIGLPFFLVPLIMRKNEFALYHAKQCLIIWLAAIVISLVNVIPCLGQIVWVVAMVALLVFNIMGLLNATKGEAKPLPLIGKFAEEWFKGITKV